MGLKHGLSPLSARSLRLTTKLHKLVLAAVDVVKTGLANNRRKNYKYGENDFNFVK